jgi:hypothetical protein
VGGIEHTLDWCLLPEDDLEVGDPLLTGKAIPVEGQTAPQGGGFEMKMGMRCGENPALTQRGYRY